MKKFRIAFIVLLMFLLTVGYSAFIKHASQLVSIVIVEANPDPGLLYDIVARPYALWIFLACVSLIVNAVWIISALRKNPNTNVYFPSALIHMLFIATCFFWNIFGLISPFIMKAYILI